MTKKLRVKARGGLKMKLKLKGKKTSKKAGLKLKGKAGLKMKVKGKKTTKKAGLKLKVKGKKTAKKTTKKAGLKLKVKGKVGAKAKVSAKPKAKVTLKAKAGTKKRRLQNTAAPASEPTMNVSSNGVNLADPQFQANVPQPTALAGDGQSSPSKSWMMFAGMMTLVALLFN